MQPFNYRKTDRPVVLQHSGYGTDVVKIINRANEGTSVNPTGVSVTEVFVTGN